VQYFEYVQRLLEQGGVVMGLLFICSLIALFIVLGRILHFHRAQIDVPEFLHGLFNVLRRNNVVEAIATCDETPGPVAYVLRTAILHCDQDESTLRHAVEEASLEEIPRLEKNLKGLATIAHVAPLLGLLGIGGGDSGKLKPSKRLDPKGSGLMERLANGTGGTCIAK